MSTPIQFGRPFALQRDRDVSGVSGTGIVALGITWPDGTAAVRWLGKHPSTVIWGSVSDAEYVHGHGGATRIVWADAETQLRHVGLRVNAEDCPACVSGPVAPPYPWICPGPPPDEGTPAEADEARADRLETEPDHAAGDHTHCGVTCEVELPTEQLRNFVIAKGDPGTAGALDELLRRAAVPPEPAADRAPVLSVAERQFLAFALDLAADQMANCGDEFTDDDKAALVKFRRLADEAQQANPLTHITARYTADTITDDHLDVLYAERDALRAELEQRSPVPATEGEEP